MKLALGVLALVVVLGAAALLPVRPYLDFQVIYHADLGLLRGISLYDHTGQAKMIAELAGVPASQVFILPFPYPPWYALSTFWLARLPINLAARAWFGLNLLLLFLSLWLLTAGQKAAKRAALFAGGLLWLPVLGSLFVGQYGFPVLLGAALVVYGLRREHTILVALAAALLMYKPHLGGMVVVLAANQLARRRDIFGRNGLLAMLSAGAIMFGTGYLASPHWPSDYVGSLIAFKDVGGVSQCTQCVSLSMAIARVAGDGLQGAVWVSVIAAVLCCGWLILRWRGVTLAPSGLVVTGTLVTLLASPYLLNYDYMLLVIPFVELARGMRSRMEWVWMTLAYALPFIGLALMGVSGNNLLILSVCILSAIAARSLTVAARDSGTGG